MRFYRRLTPIKAISFDLDDTLYSNFPVMMATDAKMIRYFAHQLPDHPNGEYDYHFWYTFRTQALNLDATLSHDVGALRLQSYYLGIQSLGFSSTVAMNMAEQALSYFVKQRSNFTVPEPVHHLLKRLKKQWPIIAISNGNVDTKAIGIHHYFDAIYHAGAHQGLQLKQKPDADMFQRTCQQFNIQPAQLLHVGDCGVNDVYGAIRFGCQTAWVSSYDVGQPITALPTMELTDVVELQRLITSI
ncbi:HAD-IA family hydrolase [Thalassotalea castellviae]|uniref:HAD-IA family hydrolase n=1 Tax=Thalassotalea castellviae TaxID=3075612 RepID=A0ABU3A581_9GAMM|nr:HAD-IA family hydrolase [Thalassotalea sp. W431]MDT0605334.1 HAD-IA family hydrolase [Thalassotalea sp. W431]